MKITVPIYAEFNPAEVIGEVTIDEKYVECFNNYYLGAGFIAHTGSNEVKELLHFGMTHINSFPVKKE